MSLKLQVKSRKSQTEDRKLQTKIVILGLFIALTILACSQTKKRNEFVLADSKSYEASLFRQNCAVCHGNEANGKEVNGVLTPSLRYGEATTLSEDQIYTQIHDGKLPMPSFKYQMTDEEIHRMVKFIRHDLQGKTE